MNTAQTVLVVGGAGEFGSRLVRGLLSQSEFHVVVAGRHPARAEALIERFADLGSKQRVTGARIDTATVTAEDLRRTKAFVVVDAAGPFQGNDGRLVRAAIAAGLHYIDLADGRDFVAAFSRFDADACAAGVTALCGASSTPALSNAVLDRLTAGWRAIDTIEIAISPGNRSAPRGLSVIRAILSYAGKPVRVYSGGRWVVRPGWGMLVRQRINGLGQRWLSLCDTPDLDVVVGRFVIRDRVVFRAGIGLALSHLGLYAASLAVRAGMLASLEPLATVFQRAAHVLAKFGDDRGGMVVEARGVDADGRPIRAVWTLIAEEGHGPFIPTLPAIAALRLLCDGVLRVPGARVCAGILPLEAIEREFAPYRIQTHVTVKGRTMKASPSPFERLLGHAFADLAEPVRRLHGLERNATVTGLADVTVDRGFLPWLICLLAGLPRAGREVPVTVVFQPDGHGREHWRRRFAARCYRSTMSAIESHEPPLLIEQFGPFGLYFRLTVRDASLDWRLVKWRFLGVPMPAWTLPRVACTESGEGERFVFDIDAAFPIAGHVIHYRGWLVEDSAPARTAA